MYDRDRAEIMKWSGDLERSQVDRNVDALNSLELSVNLRLSPKVGHEFAPGAFGHHCVAGVRKSDTIEKALVTRKEELF